MSWKLWNSSFAKMAQQTSADPLSAFNFQRPTSSTEDKIVLCYLHLTYISV